MDQTRGKSMCVCVREKEDVAKAMLQKLRMKIEHKSALKLQK